MKKIVMGAASGSTDGPKSAAQQTSKLLGKVPNLVAHCSVNRYDDGTARRTGWFTVKTLGASWVVQIKDPDAKASLSVTAQSLDDALGLADAMIGAESAPWEPDPFLQDSDKKKKRS